MCGWQTALAGTQSFAIHREQHSRQEPDVLCMNGLRSMRLGLRCGVDGFRHFALSSRSASRSMVTMLCICDSAARSTGHVAAAHACRSCAGLLKTRRV